MHLYVLGAVLKGLLLGMFMAISVGPTLFAIIKYSLNHSYKSGLAFVLGVSLSDILYVTLANVAASWLEIIGSYKKTLAIGGALVLITAGLISLFSHKVQAEASNSEIKITGKHYFRIFVGGFLINSFNPGVIISWLTAVTATANSTTFFRIILFGTCLVFILSVDFMKVFLADKIKKKLTPNTVMLLQKISSIILIVLGVVLAITTFFNNW